MPDKPTEPSGKTPAPGTPPEDAPPPPPKIVDLPDPDGFGDINQRSKVHQEQAKAEKKDRKKKTRRHPKDTYRKLKKGKFGCGGCLLVLLFLVVLPLGGATLWINALKTDLTGEQGYAWVTNWGSNIAEAPADKTAYLGVRVLYEAPETDTEIAFIGGQWWIGGTFREKVTFRGAQLVVEPGSRFLKGLDVEAIRYQGNGAVIEGDLTGRILHQSSAD